MLDLIDPNHSGRSAGPVLAIGRQQPLAPQSDPPATVPVAVPLDDVDVCCRQPRAGQCRADDALLGRSVRGGQSVGGAILI